MKNCGNSIFGTFISICITVIAVTLAAETDDSFTEELFIKQFETGHVYFHFQFTTTWNDKSKSFSHYRVFPKPLGDVLWAYSVQELHLSLTQGVWRHEKWGFPVIDAPPGAELWVWFRESLQSVDQPWADLTNALSGLFCASLNFMDSKSTTSPRWSFRPAGLASPQLARNSSYLKYSALPRELVCTENLTPWKKLLPCDTKAGLAQLLNAIKLYDASYHSLGVHVRPICQNPDCLSSSVELSLSLAIVFNPVTAKNSGGFQSWSLKSLFDRTLYNKCPLAEESQIYLDMDSESEFTLSPAPTSYIDFTRGGEQHQYAVYDIGELTSDGNIINLDVRYPRPMVYSTVSPPSIHAHRFITGYGLEHGGITCHLHNHLPHNLTVLYMETLPWFTRVYYNTLTIHNEGAIIQPKNVHYIPGKDRERPYLLELMLTIPADSVTTISFKFDCAFLKWTEYPPDANHGFYINSAVVSAMLPTGEGYISPTQTSSRLSTSLNDTATQFFMRLHTETLLVSLPTPDFSMPYNVICLACTVVAIAFGSIHNLTTRTFEAVDPEKEKEKSFMAKVKRFFKRLRGQKKADLNQTSDDSSEKKETSERSQLNKELDDENT